MPGLEELWPLFDLRLRTADLELRVPTDDLAVELAELAQDPIHDPATMPFYVPWTDAPEAERARSVLQWHWRCRGEWTPDSWRLELVALRDGQVVGTQGMHAVHFATTREVETGSWVGRRFQRMGIGRLMRQAVLHLAFRGLEAERARSAAFADNQASQRVSAGLGYTPDGTETRVRRGEAAVLQRLVLTRHEWERRSAGWPAVTIDGLAGCLDRFGLDRSGAVSGAGRTLAP